MIALRFRPCAFAATGVSLAGFSGSQPPIGAAGPMAQSRAIATSDRGGSWTLPEAKSEDLLYATDLEEGVFVYSYPGARLIGQLTAYEPFGDCVDDSGNVYIAEAYGVEEYRHGGSEPIKTFDPDGGFGDFASCTSAARPEILRS